MPTQEENQLIDNIDNYIAALKRQKSYFDNIKSYFDNISTNQTDNVVDLFMNNLHNGADYKIIFSDTQKQHDLAINSEHLRKLLRDNECLNNTYRILETIKTTEKQKLKLNKKSAFNTVEDSMYWRFFMNNNDVIRIINESIFNEEKDLTMDEFHRIQDNQYLDCKFKYQGENSEEKTFAFQLLKIDGEVFLFATRLDKILIQTKITNFNEISDNLNQGNVDYLITQENIKSISQPISKIEVKEKTKISELLKKLELEEDTKLSKEDKAQLLMIKHSFISPGGFDDKINKPLDLEETKDFLRFLSGKDCQNPVFKARLALCDARKLEKITQIYGKTDSFAHCFFQESQVFAFATRDSIRIGIPQEHIEENDKQEIITGKRYLVYTSGAHDFGFVFNTTNEGTTVYIQDSTTETTEEKQKIYNQIIKNVYGENSIDNIRKIKTAKRKKISDEEGCKLFSKGQGDDGGTQSDGGIQSECRYTAMICSEEVMEKLENNQQSSLEAFSIEYDQEYFIDKFATWYDKEMSKQAAPLVSAEPQEEAQEEATPEPQEEAQEEATPEPQEEATPEPQEEAPQEAQEEATPEPQQPLPIFSKEINLKRAYKSNQETTFFHPTLTINNIEEDLSTNNPERFDFSVKQKSLSMYIAEGTGEIKYDRMNRAIQAALNEALNQTTSQDQTFDHKKAAICIMLAIKNGGVGNKKDTFKREMEELGLKKEDFKSCAFFSKQFQKIAGEQMGICTGNSNYKNLVGMRLKRLTPDYAYTMLGDDHKNIKEKFDEYFVPHESVQNAKATSLGVEESKDEARS